MTDTSFLPPKFCLPSLVDMFTPKPYTEEILNNCSFQCKQVYKNIQKTLCALPEFFFNIYLFIWLCQVLVAAGGLLSCGIQTLSCGMHVGSSSLTRDQTQAPSIGSAESYSLHHQGSP